ncbi:MAG: isopentenyl-diphosphate Delta-isomerase [Bacteroidota bacterium]|nr:isopentenyl-diphosphate Delta-isomerase [Bacteroidota bacterium]MDP3144328.1 isopentenyl-diphosphate Delta-isomerase [Bacteroidota bacterium]MDP3556314.1 isopentenyl-diphosphate Delta-isomerase [Bacteroidota bacterium]
MEENVILVDELDNAIGVMEKMEAHQKGVLHRAFSVFIFNENGEMLLQQRALNKYHSAGLWTNTCCSHPRPNENTLDAANRRLMEEMGIECELSHKNHFIYKSIFENGLIEHELDHVFFGNSNQKPKPNKDEVENYAWMNLKQISSEIEMNPDRFTTWFKIAMKNLFSF